MTRRLKRVVRATVVVGVIHPDYHTPTDTADKIGREFFGDVADMIVDAIRTFDARLP